MVERISPQSRQQIEEKLGEFRGGQIGEAVAQILEFDKTPTDLKAFMDGFVIGQEKGKKIIPVAITYHYRRLANALKHAMVEDGDDLDAALRNATTPKANVPIVGPGGIGRAAGGDRRLLFRFHCRGLANALKPAMGEDGDALDAALRNATTPKANVLIVGPSGCGKTYTGEIASRLVGVPFAVEDLTKFSEVGYVGQNVSNNLMDLRIAAGVAPHAEQMGG